MSVSEQLFKIIEGSVKDIDNIKENELIMVAIKSFYAGKKGVQAELLEDFTNIKNKLTIK